MAIDNGVVNATAVTGLPSAIIISYIPITQRPTADVVIKDPRYCIRGNIIYGTACSNVVSIQPTKGTRSTAVAGLLSARPGRRLRASFLAWARDLARRIVLTALTSMVATTQITVGGPLRKSKLATSDIAYSCLTRRRARLYLRPP